MRAIICAAGDGTRWANYLNRRKHQLEFEGESLLNRTVRLLRERGITDIFVTHTAQHPYFVRGAQSFERPAGLSNTQARLATRPLWHPEQRTLILWGDVYFTNAAMDLMTGTYPGWVNFARLRASQVTGKPGPEIFGCAFWPEQHDRYANALQAVDDAKARGEETHSSWSSYLAMVGKPLNIHPSDIRDWGCHVEIPDDGTDDFDFGDDYERWMRLGPKRSARRVIAADFEQPWFQSRVRELRSAFKLHRKLWEHASIAQAFHDRIYSGGKVLGFGVGKEPLPAWFAARGAHVVATDRPDPGVWLTQQHARGLDELRREGICDDETFRERVTYAPADMRNLPDELCRGEFDMTWSSSCFEHLGSINAGLDFFCAQMRCLKQGGIAVHTTEYNIASNSHTLEHPELVVFRRVDFERLEARLRAQGDCLWPITLTGGDSPADQYVDREPFQTEPHLNIHLGGHTFTSVLLIAMRGRF